MSNLDLFVPTRAPSPRVNRVEKEIRAILSNIFQRQDIPPIFSKLGDVIPFPGIVTITRVKISPDLRECKVFLRPLIGEHAEKVVDYFSVAVPVIRKLFAQQSRLRVVPNFKFEIDLSFEAAERIDELLRKNAERAAKGDEGA
ncbi:MAG: 30S ribosome-binding factor RbfA [Holosporales bacterium]|nr:30S ribosome-binding factor RbfA [Holosporales bacterium]